MLRTYNAERQLLRLLPGLGPAWKKGGKGAPGHTLDKFDPIKQAQLDIVITQGKNSCRGRIRRVDPEE